MKIDEITGVISDARTFAPSPLLPTNDFVGVEVELEGFKNYGIGFESDLWEVKEDPSLRGGGREFAYHKPLNGQDILTSLEEFDTFIEWYEKNNGQIEVTDRTSVHVHLDVRSLQVHELLNLALLFMTFEPAIMKLFGPGREDSNYCLPLEKGTDRHRLAGLLKEDSHSILNAINSSKYSAFNTLPIKELGSVEFRIHVGTKSSSDLYNWICVILWMKKYARTMDVDVLRYPTYVSEKGMEVFVREVFQTQADQFLYQGYQEDLYQGTRVAQDTVIRNSLKAAHMREVHTGDKKNPCLELFKGVVVKEEPKKEKEPVAYFKVPAPPPVRAFFVGDDEAPDADMWDDVDDEDEQEEME